jgi:two-component system osmolarity sensor histidine kinase EnvZ
MFKRILPQTLFYRYLLIIVTPIFLFQIIIAIVFFDSLWIKTNKRLVQSLSEEINSFIKLYTDEKNTNKKSDFINIFNTKTSSFYKITKNKIPKEQGYSQFSFYDRLLLEEFSNSIKYKFWFNSRYSRDDILLFIDLKKEMLEITIQKNRIRNTSGRIFILWIIVPAVLLILISILFLRNQIRPITNLANSAEKFGKGIYTQEMRPSGAVEIRKAITEFEKMKKRILRHISQRSTMLSGISHDLKTPLTRLKLQIEILNKEGKLNRIKDDILEMEKMISEYLDYSNSQSNETSTKFNLTLMMTEIYHKFNNPKITLKCKENFFLTGRQHLIKRSIYNVVENAMKYAGNADIEITKSKSAVLITVDDQGPGVPEKERENILKPFYRIDKSRGQAHGSVGLGLSIVQDIVNSHGGNIMIENNPKGKGLRVKLIFPS